MDLYTIPLETIDGKETTLKPYQDQVVLIVNTASKCGFTPQFEGLEKLYKTYKDKGFTVLGFPCNQFMNQDPGTEEEILSFCKTHFSVTFPMFKKTQVKGKNKHPLFDLLLKMNSNNDPIQWNFEKFLINKDGQLIKRFTSRETPETIEPAIQSLLEKT